MNAIGSILEHTLVSGTLATIGKQLAPYGDLPLDTIKSKVFELRGGFLNFLSNPSYDPATFEKHAYSFKIGATIGLTASLINRLAQNIHFLNEHDTIRTTVSYVAAVFFLSAAAGSPMFPISQDTLWYTFQEMLFPLVFIAPTTYAINALTRRNPFLNEHTAIRSTLSWIAGGCGLYAFAFIAQPSTPDTPSEPI